MEWIGVDLDGTLAYYDEWKGYDHIGEPIPEMMKKIKNLIRKGYTIKIFTARAGDEKTIPVIKKWLKKNGLPDLEITNKKDYHMISLIDDRCIQVIQNTGKLVGSTSNIEW